MKRCCHCHKLLPESEFYKCKREKDGFNNSCKNCQDEYRKKYEIKKYINESILSQTNNIIGGYKVSILNHASRFENKYTIAGTDGNYYATNNKGEFLDYLRGIL